MLVIEANKIESIVIEGEDARGKFNSGLTHGFEVIR